jgi:tetratricopeptide (TPR) repeat protein
MSKSTTKQIFLALFLSALVTGPMVNRTLAAGTDTPSAPPPAATTTPPAAPTAQPADSKSAPPAETKPDAKKSDKKSSLDDPAFLKGYRAAYATIYEDNDYAAAIPQLEALGQNDRADVANLIGYSYRKLGNYQLASAWYERALKADPNHVRTWQYYGLWQVEQGNREQARYHLAKIAALAGTGSIEYQSLAAALANGKTSY